MRWTSLLLLIGCAGDKPGGPENEPPFSDTGDPGETDETDETDEVELDEECPESAPANGVVPVETACYGAENPPPSWDLVVRSTTPLATFGAELHVTRAEDVDGNGVIDVEDPMQIVVDDGVDVVAVYDADGRWRRNIKSAYRACSAVGDIYPAREGGEILVDSYEMSAQAYLSLTNGTERLYEVDGGSELALPWLADLDGDGTVEALIGPAVYNAATGELVDALDDFTPNDSSRTISADLDGDGTQEILAGHADPNDVRLYEADGTLRNICYTGSGPGGTGFAVGNLDSDPEAEIVAMGNDFIVECDTDGTLMRMTQLGTQMPPTIAIGELDGDPEPEIVYSDISGVVALELDLSVKWMYVIDGPSWQWTPLSLADLDGDGRHEVLVHDVQNRLVVYSPEGEVLATVPLATPYGGWSSRSQPVVADIDGDSLAEIVVGDLNLVVITNADGGWRLPEADHPWPGTNRFPGDRTIEGGVPPAPFPWSDPARNVWNGLPPGAEDRPDLGVVIADLCIDSCVGDATVTVEVTNTGPVEIPGDVTVRIRSLLTDDLLASALIPGPFPSGMATSRLLAVPAGRVSEGIEARVSAGVTECALASNVAEWRDTRCD